MRKGYGDIRNVRLVTAIELRARVKQNRKKRNKFNTVPILEEKGQRFSSISLQN